jgi:hypothetical protein
LVVQNGKILILKELPPDKMDRIADERASSGVKYTDILYQRFSSLLGSKRPKYDVNKKLYKVNWYSEKIMAIMCANHHHYMALFAIAAYCCIHVI